MFSLKAVIQRSVQRGGGMLALWVVEADFMHSLVFLLLLESRFILLCSCCYESWDRSVVRDLWVTFRGSGNVKLLFWHWFLYIYIILFFFSIVTFYCWRLASLQRQCKNSCGRAWGTVIESWFGETQVAGLVHAERISFQSLQQSLSSCLLQSIQIILVDLWGLVITSSAYLCPVTLAASLP